jgi:hypothetical protein
MTTDFTAYKVSIEKILKGAGWSTPPFRFDPGRRVLTRCQADDDGYCDWQGCPQLRDKEPRTTGRHCPLDSGENRKEAE